MRGKGAAEAAGTLDSGITPAHAGKSISVLLTYLNAEDHPRPCGEKISARLYFTPRSGSPPPMRGKAKRSFNVPFHVGITPAHAGKRSRAPSSSSYQQDHPRPCGEKDVIVAGKHVVGGSPPPMRGKVIPSVNSVADRRITPAHAGKRIFNVPFASIDEDHPRPCGEKGFDRRGLGRRGGSPPPMRGKEPRHPPPAVCGGITPAHAGKRGS